MEALASPIRILLIDDHALFGEAALRLLASEAGFQTVGWCGSVDEGVAILSTTGADVVLLDLDLGKARAFSFFEPARAVGFHGHVLIVAAVVSPFEARRLVQLGAAGIFLKQNPPPQLTRAIRSIAGGEPYFDSELEPFLQSDRDVRASQDVLTSRESAVLSGILEGLTNKEIAGRVHVSEALVKATLQTLFDKHGVRTRSQLLRIALEQYPDQLSSREPDRS
jgi:DNA-binding NarL/FixJ family response regulator